MSEEKKAPESGEGKKSALQEAEGRLLSAFEENTKKFKEQVEAQIKEIEAKGKPNEKLGEELTEAKESLEALRLEIEQVKALSDKNAADKAEPAERTGIMAKLAQVREEYEERYREAKSRGVPFKFAIKLDNEPLFGKPERLETKTTITSSAVGSSTPGILVPERVREYVPGAERRLTLRDALPVRPTEANTVEFPKENVFTNAASPQVEASDKAESALTFTIASEAVRTLAHWIPASSQVLSDWPQLERIIRDKMLYGLKLDEEDEILNGSGTGEHLNGLVTQATAYAGTYDVAADTRLDTLRWALLEVEDDDEDEPDLMVISPKTWYTILGIKDQASNVGNYVVGDPISGGLMGATTLWGKGVIRTNSMGADNFLVGPRRQAEIFDRQAANVMISTEHNDYFIKNLVAIRVEERLTLAVYRPAAWIYGTFS